VDGVSLEQLLEADPVHQRHGQEEAAVDLAEVQHLDDVGMGEQAAESGFVDERAVEDAIGAERGVDPFERAAAQTRSSAERSADSTAPGSAAFAWAVASQNVAIRMRQRAALTTPP